MYVWSVGMMSSSGLYQVFGLKLPVFPQILEKKSSYKATFSPDNNLGSQVLVLGHKGGRKKRKHYFGSCSQMWQETGRIENLQGLTICAR